MDVYAAMPKETVNRIYAKNVQTQQKLQTVRYRHAFLLDVD